MLLKKVYLNKLILNKNIFSQLKKSQLHISSATMSSAKELIEKGKKASAFLAIDENVNRVKKF